MKKILLYVLSILFAASVTTQAQENISAQDSNTMYDVPFASKGNTVELSIANKSSDVVTKLKVEHVSILTGIHVISQSKFVKTIGAGEEQNITFTFSVDKTVAVNQEAVLKFVVSSSEGESWTKEVKIRITAPDHFEISQNYPNPFNPTTVIGYLLPTSGNVVLSVYNMLGQRVVAMLDEVQEAGYHEIKLSATDLSSGVYMYEVAYTDAQNSRQFQRKMMMVVK